MLSNVLVQKQAYSNHTKGLVVCNAILEPNDLCEKKTKFKRKLNSSKSVDRHIA